MMRWIWRWLIAIIVLPQWAAAQMPEWSPENVVPGEMLLQLKPGRTLETARLIANTVNAQVQPIPVQDVYVLRLPNNGIAPELLIARVREIIDRLKDHPDVLYIEPHYIRHRHAEPNDPRLSDQWALFMMQMPEAWDIEKGKQNIRIAFIDDNFQNTHPDLLNVFEPDLSRNFTTNDANQLRNIAPEGAGFSHGTATVGVAAARTDNGLGIAGAIWNSERVIVGLKVARTPNDPLLLATILQAYQYVRDRASQIHVLNMSYGGFGYSRIENELIQEIYRAGVIPVASAGNERTSIPTYPSSYENVVRVAAVGPTGERAFYSNFADIDLAAPGGDQQSEESDGVLTTATTSRLYEYTQGTSFSAPYVSAALALLLAAGARRHNPTDVEPQAVIALKETADPRGRIVPDPELGFGIINVAEALRGVAGLSIVFLEPASGVTIETTRVRVRVSLRRVQNVDPANILEVRLNDDPLERSLWAPTAEVIPERKTILLNFVVTVPSPGAYTISVTAVGEDGNVRSGSTRVLVKARVQNEGLAMFSTPYILRRPPEEIFGSEVILARYLPALGTYARYSAVNPDERASFAPRDAGVRPDGSNTPTPPRGLGYFVRTTTPAFILGDEAIDPNTAYLIPLQEGWNMIGNPFPFNVPWAACEVEIIGAGGIAQRISLQEAADREYIRLQIYRYIPLTGEYTWRTAPLGELIAWQAHWVKALKPCTLVVPPVGSLRSRSDDTPRVAPTQSDGWLLRLIARSGNREDSNNLIGTTATANDGVGHEDVEKPPLFQSYVALRLIEPRTRSALAQDIRRGNRRTHRWEVEVITDQPNAEVTLQWVQELPVPKGTRLILTDQTTGTRLSMLQNSSYQFRTDETSRRRFVIEAHPARANRLQVTNVSITQMRGSQFTIQYVLNSEASVQVLIQDSTGKTIARLQGGTRSPGVSTASWNGRNEAGIAVPPGTYQVHIVATDDSGEVVRTVRPLVVAR